MKNSESIVKIAAALAKAQKFIGAAPKEAQNPFFKSTYADLGSVMAVCKEPLLSCGITVLQLVGHDTNGPTLETVLLHESGECIVSEMRIVVSKANDPQSMGAAITYARRYALQAMVFIPSVDDDGEWADKALGHQPTEEQRQQAELERQQRALEEKRAELSKQLEKTGGVPEGAKTVEQAPKPETKPEAEKKPEAAAEKPAKPPKPAPKATPAPEEKPAPKAPESALDGPIWSLHVISAMNHPKFTGRKVGDLSLEELENLDRAWSEKYAEAIAKDPAKIELRRHLKDALAARKAEIAK